MLVATAAVSFIAPLAAQASDVNLDGMNSYKHNSTARIDSKTFINEVDEEIATLNSRIDGLEAQQNNLEAGSFSDTTTLDGTATFSLGGTDSSLVKADGTDSLQFAYTYQLNLNTSFTGDDNLYVRLKTGNHTGYSVSKTLGTYLKSGNGNANVLEVDKIWYTFPVGEKMTAWVGPLIENYYMHGTTPSLYQPVTKQFVLGGNSPAYGASTDSGAGAAYKADNGFAVSTNVVSKQAGTNNGLLTDQSKLSWATQVGYTKPQYSVSALVNVKANSWSDGYYEAASHTGTAKSGATEHGNFTAIGLRGWWRPEASGTATPSVSLGYDTASYTEATDATDTSSAWFAGFMWEDMFQADDKIGVAFGQPMTNESNANDPFAYEVYYSFKANDSVTITPAVFGGQDRSGTAGDDVVGAVLETTFRF